MKRTAWYIHDGRQHHMVSVEAEAFIRKDEREKIAAWLEAQGWGRQDSVGVVTRSYAARIRNGEHDTRSNDHSTSDSSTNDS